MTNQKLTEEEQDNLNQQLFDAVLDNNLSAVKTAIKAGANVNAENGWKKSILPTTIKKNIKIVKCLLEAGADPNTQDYRGYTALHEAAATLRHNVYTDEIKLLLKYNANIYVKNKLEETPFNISLLYNNYDAAELFISAGYIPSKEDMQKIKDNKLFKAVKEGNLPAVKVAIADGADVNAMDNNGAPLLLDIHFTNINVLRYLLENGMNPNMKDNYGQSFLHKLSRAENIYTVKLLLEYGADMTLKDQWGDTPFGEAITVKYDVAELFILNGYVPSESEFNLIKDETIRESFMTLTAKVQEHQAKLTEEAKAAEFSYVDEIIEM